MRKIALGAAPLLLALCASAASAEPGWRLSEVSGDVRVISNGSVRPATRGALLASGSTVVAGALSKAVIVRSKDVVVVSANSRIRLIPPEQQKGFFQVISEFGTSLFTIEHKKQPHFGVQTPYLAAVVKGTVFSVTVTASGASVQVTQGAVDVATLDGGAHELIRPGMIGSVGAGDRYQLRVEGDSSRVLQSGNAPAHGAVTVPAPASAADAPAPAEAEEDEVTDSIGTGSVSVAEATGGLVQGSAGLDAALATAGASETGRHGENGGSNAGAGSGSGKGHEGDNAGGNGSGNNGQGNGNSGGSSQGGNGGQGSGNAGGGGGSDKGGQGSGNSNGGGGNGGQSGGNSSGDNAGGNGGGTGQGGSNGGRNGGAKDDDKGKVDDGKGKADDDKSGKNGDDKGKGGDDKGGDDKGKGPGGNGQGEGSGKGGH